MVVVPLRCLYASSVFAYVTLPSHPGLLSEAHQVAQVYRRLPRIDGAEGKASSEILLQSAVHASNEGW